MANSTVPVIETGTGNCHVYVDETADISMAADIIENAKTQRMGVCNACESLVIHSGRIHCSSLCWEEFMLVSITRKFYMIKKHWN